MLLTPFVLDIEHPLDLSRHDKTLLLRKAIAANPASIAVRSKLAAALFGHDAFDEAIELLEGLRHDAPDVATLALLAEAYLTRETAAGDAQAEAAARAAVALADQPWDRAHMLATLGKALTRQGRTAEARAALIAALDADPQDRNAYKRLAALDLAASPDATLALADRLLAQGVAHSRLLTARAIALARMGRIDAAREAVGLDRFLYRTTLQPPPPWDGIDALNAAVRAELAVHPDLRFDRYGTASSETWRIDAPAFRSSQAIPALQALVRDAVVAHVATLDTQDTPWTNARPARAVLHNWVVMTDAVGHEEWHVHQHGWMSGVYYVDVPPPVRAGETSAGCIAFGLPEDQVGAAAARDFGETIVRPQPGLLMLFPSHCHHRTFAHGSDARRICMAFDIQPA